MATLNGQSMALSADKLNEADQWLLDYFSDAKRATPNLLLLRYNETHEDVSRQWISSRVRRLAEHGHIKRVHPDDSTYEFVSDPRDAREEREP